MTRLVDVPRRCRVDLQTPAEAAIRGAIAAVEATGADIKLTYAVICLSAALDWAAHFADGTDAEAGTWPTQSPVAIGKIAP